MQITTSLRLFIVGVILVFAFGCGHMKSSTPDPTVSIPDRNDTRPDEVRISPDESGAEVKKASADITEAPEGSLVPLPETRLNPVETPATDAVQPPSLPAVATKQPGPLRRPKQPQKTDPVKKPKHPLKSDQVKKTGKIKKPKQLKKAKHSGSPGQRKATRHGKLRYYATGKASFYANMFQSRLTANGERFDQRARTAAHKTLPFGTWVKVTNIKNKKSVIVRINDRGPYIRGRIIDLSRSSFKCIGDTRTGILNVTLHIIENSNARSR